METLTKPDSIVDIPEFYNSSLHAISEDFAPRIHGLLGWQEAYQTQDLPLELYLKKCQEEAGALLAERERNILTVVRDAFPLILGASDLPEDDKKLLISLSKPLGKNFLGVEKGVDRIENEASSEVSRVALRTAIDGAIPALIKDVSNPAKLQRYIRLTDECSSSAESRVAVRQVIDARIFNEVSGDFAWIDLITSKKRTLNRQYSDQVIRKVMKIAHEHNVLKGALHYSMTPREDIELYVSTNKSKNLMLEAVAEKEMELNDT